MNITSNFIALILLLLFAGCSSNPQSIDKISYNCVGGETGGYANVEITKDSLNGTIGSPNKKITIKEEIRKTFWDSLTKSITLDDFKKIKTGRSVVHIDGIDVSVKIETGEDSCSFLNGDTDRPQNKKVLHFMDILENELRNKFSMKGIQDE